MDKYHSRWFPAFASSVSRVFRLIALVVTVFTTPLLLSPDLSNPQMAYAASFTPQVKGEIAIFPFRNNTDIPGLSESIPDVLRGELHLSGMFDVVERKRLYKTIWRIAVSGALKIDNARGAAGGPDGFLDQEVDLFSRLERVDVERVSDFVGADYVISGAVNRFGDMIRIGLELSARDAEEKLIALSADIDDVEDIPGTVREFAVQVEGVYKKIHIDEFADAAIGLYRGGMVTFGAMASALEDMMLEVPESVYAATHLFLLYKEEGLDGKAVETCESIVSTALQHSEAALITLAGMGVDPFEELAGYYDTNNKLQDAVDLYTVAIKTIPLNTAIYYRGLGSVLLRLGRLTEAVDALEHARTLAPSDFSARCLLGIAYEVDGDAPKALAEYEACLKYSGGREDGLPIDIDVVKGKIGDLRSLIETIDD